MPTHVRLVHHTLGDGRFHVYTSPEMPGLHVTADTMAEAQRSAIDVVDFIAERRGWGSRSYPSKRRSPSRPPSDLLRQLS